MMTKSEYMREGTKANKIVKKGGNVAKIFQVGRDPSYWAGVRGRISPTAKLHSSVVSQSWQTYAQLSGYSRDSATNGNKERKLLTNVYFSPFHPFRRHLFSPYCQHYFSFLVIQLFLLWKVQFILTLPANTVLRFFNQFQCRPAYVTVWLADWVTADVKLEGLCLFLDSSTDVWVYIERENLAVSIINSV